MSGLTVNSVSFSYGTSEAVSSLSASFGGGELVGILGANGSGKTTLLKLLSGILKPKSGNIELRGKDLRAIPRRELARAVSLVPQDGSSDIPFTVRELVAMGRTPHLGHFTPERTHDKESIDNALRLADLTHLKDRLAAELSTGERKRCFIARALCQETDIVLLDEPTANLDPAHELNVIDLLKRMSEAGKLVILALHDLALALRFFDRVLVLNQGQLVADGSPSSILTTELLGRYFGVYGRLVEMEGEQLLVISQQERSGLTPSHS